MSNYVSTNIIEWNEVINKSEHFLLPTENNYLFKNQK